MDNLRESIWTPASVMLVKAYDFALQLILAIIVFIIGWFIAKLVRQVVVKVLKLLKLDVGSDKLGIENILIKGDIKYTLSELIGVIIYWIVMLAVLAGVVNYLQLTAIADLLTKVVQYLPNVLGSILVLVLGIFFASFISSIIRTAASNAGVVQARSLGNIAQIIIMVFAVVLAIEQLKIDTAGVLVYSLNIILAAVGLAFAIAFGLGCKDIAGNVISDLLEKMKKG